MPIAVVARPAIRERKETFCTLPPRIKGDEIILLLLLLLLWEVIMKMMVKWAHATLWGSYLSYPGIELNVRSEK